MQRVWQEIYDRGIYFVVSYNRKVKYNESKNEIDEPSNFLSLFKDKSATPIDKHSRPIHKIIFILWQYDKGGKVKEELLEKIYTLPTLCGSMLPISKNKARNIHKSQEQSRYMKYEGCILSFDTDSGKMVPSQEECGVFLNKRVIIRDYWYTKIKVEKNCTQLLML